MHASSLSTQPQAAHLTLVVGESEDEADVSSSIQCSQLKNLLDEDEDSTHSKGSEEVQGGRTESKDGVNNLNFSSVLTANYGPWNNPPSESTTNNSHRKMTITIDRKNKNRKVIPKSPEKTTFIGKRWVPSTVLYLKNFFTAQDSQKESQMKSCHCVLFSMLKPRVSEL